MKNKTILGHLMVLFTMLVWGTTFISTKILLKDLAPVEILFTRFLLGYCLLLLLYPKFHRFGKIKEELVFFLCGASGVTVYFLAENTALQYTQASNVGLLVSVAPVLTALLAHLWGKEERFTKNIFLGFLIAFAGMFLVIFNGRFILKLNPLGDFLAVSAALCWAVYSNLLKKMGGKYSALYTTRKIFFYGLLTMIPLLFILKPSLNFHVLTKGLNLPNLLFLGLVASALCYVLWNTAVDYIGVVKSSSYIYLIPLITIVTAVIVLHERITPLAMLGAFLILCGVFISERGFTLPFLKQKLKVQ